MKTVAVTALLFGLAAALNPTPASAAHTPDSSCISGWEWSHLRAAVAEPGVMTLADISEYLDGPGRLGAAGARQFRVCRRASVRTRVVVATRGAYVVGVMKVHPGRGFELRT